MKIIFIDYDCFNKIDTLAAFEKMGHEVIKFYHEDYNALKSETYTEALTKDIESMGAGMVFSYNYFPLVATACKESDVPYVSFVYDSPYTYIYSYTVAFPTNHIFLFDRSWVAQFNSGGLMNVHYMVLPGNPDRAKSINKKEYNPARTKCDVSFVGKLYNEKHNFYERLIEKTTDKYLIGYLEGMMEAQQKLYGQSIIESMLTDEIIKRMEEALYVEEEPLGVEPKGYRYANYFIKRKITQTERIRLLTRIGKEFGGKYDIRLFTPDKNFSVDGVKNMGSADYENEMAYVFSDSKINLNISLRSIETGIPLRCVDIMSQGGFLLSNYQADLVTDFVAGEEFDFFGDPDDMMAKIEYYLTHEKEREQIAENGRERVSQLYNFDAVFGRIFDIVFGETNG